jgi:HSP20 family protein
MNALTRYSHPTWPSLFDRDEFLTPFSSLFDEIFNESFPSLDVGFLSKNAYPKVDIIDEETQVIINAEIPGVSKEQVKVELNDDVLSIKGEKQQEVKDEKKNYIHRELKKSSFCRSFTVGSNINKETVNAKFENGILTITLKKLMPTPKKQSKVIDVK